MTLEGVEASTLAAIDHCLWPRSYAGKVATATAQIFALIGLTIGASLLLDRLLERVSLRLSQGLLVGGAAYSSKFTEKVTTSFFKHQMKGLVRHTARDGRHRLEVQINEELGEVESASDSSSSGAAVDRSLRARTLRVVRSALHPRSRLGKVAFTLAECLFLVGIAILISEAAERIPSKFGQKAIVITVAHLVALLEGLARSSVRHTMEDGFEELGETLRRRIQNRREELSQAGKEPHASEEASSELEMSTEESTVFVQN